MVVLEPNCVREFTRADVTVGVHGESCPTSRSVKLKAGSHPGPCTPPHLVASAHVLYDPRELCDTVTPRESDEEEEDDEFRTLRCPCTAVPCATLSVPGIAQ